MQINVTPYMDKQIESEERYYDELMSVLLILLGLLDGELKSKRASKQSLLVIFNRWRQQNYDTLLQYLNNQVWFILNVASYAIGQPQKAWLKDWQYHKLMSQDLVIELDFLLNAIASRYTSAIPTGAILTGIVAAVLVPSDQSPNELNTRCQNSIRRFVQFNTSQGVSNAIVAKIREFGITQYQAGNEQDDRVRKLHKEQNDFKTWHDLNNPPSTGYPGTEPGCRCSWIAFR